MEKTISFEENLKALEKIVSDLEKGDVPLEEAIKKFNEANDIAVKCNKTLEEANKTITKIVNKDKTEEQFEINE